MENLLLKKLNEVNAQREKRLSTAKYVLSHTEELPVLITYCFQNNDHTLSYKACWVLEFVAKENLTFIFPYISNIVHQIPKVNHESAIRSLAKITELICIFHSKQKTSIEFKLTKDDIEKIITYCFDWLIATHKVAIKAHAMQCLLLLSKECSWVQEELKIILQQNFKNHSAAYQARARNILKKLT
ncbi:adenylosuccinate lyase [Zhouia sp. PK063]|uniref:adenylosuccinate lyase n=1 Tax=Zhouia sp. PK063 TaxID=3373602 RepID=UPI0037AFE813